MPKLENEILSQKPGALLSHNVSNCDEIYMSITALILSAYMLPYDV